MSSNDPLLVLYVDDDKDIRHIVKLSLALDSAIDLRIYADGPEALDAIGSDEWRPDLVMLDVMMPKMDGPTLMTAIKAYAGFDDVPFIFVTARAREADVQRYYDAGAAGVILKPFDPLSLASNIRSIAGR